MSDSYLILIAEDPKFQPDEEQLEQARDYLEEIADAEEVELTHSGELEFYDCGENFEQLFCPACGLELSIDWWRDQMDEAFRGDGVELRKLEMPCCGAKRTLHELRYVWPQGFGTFSLQAMNPGLEELEEDHRLQLEEIIGTKLRVIHQHI